MSLSMEAGFLSILLAFYLPFILFDNLTAFESIKQSAIFVWGYGWQTFAVLLTPLLLGVGLLFFTSALMEKNNLLGANLAVTLANEIIKEYINEI
jgi:hypothetical protein